MGLFNSLLYSLGRPQWDSSWTKEQLVEKEKEAFFEWRRKLSQLEANDNLCLTPFEKNLEVWRQLWRVVERSEVVVQVIFCTCFYFEFLI